MLIEKTKEELLKLFESDLLTTNRGFNYYVDWKNALDYKKHEIELNAMNALIGKKDSFKNVFFQLLEKLPSVIITFPLLIALARVERKSLIKGNKFRVIGTEIDTDDYQEYRFNNPQTLTKNEIESYYNFFEQMGLRNLFENMLEKSVVDYVIGVLVGLDSNGRKNRGGAAFELACEPIIKEICDKYNISVITQKQFKELIKKGFSISQDIENRKADFIIFNITKRIIMNIEVNFFNGGGSKPEEIIDSYINRQNDLNANGISFALITDGNCWRGTTHQLSKGFRHIHYLMNYKLLKKGLLEEIIKKVFGIHE